MTKTLTTINGFAVLTTAAAMVLLVGCSDSTTETQTPSTTEAEQTPSTTADVERSDITTTTTEPPPTVTEPESENEKLEVVEVEPEPDPPSDSTPDLDLEPVIEPELVPAEPAIDEVEEPPTTTTTISPTTTTTPPTTTTAKPAPKTDADFRAIAAAGGIPYDPDSPNGIHVSYFWPDGLPEPELFYIPDSELPEDYHLLYEYTDSSRARHKIPERLNFTCDSPGLFEDTIRDEWELVLAGSHFRYKEPYHDCEWALRWYVLGLRQRLAGLRPPEIYEYSIELGLTNRYTNEDLSGKLNAEDEVITMFVGMGRDTPLIRLR